MSHENTPGPRLPESCSGHAHEHIRRGAGEILMTRCLLDEPITGTLSGMTTTEWGVRWPDGSVSTLDDDLDEFSEASAREYVADGCATLVARQVTEWREVTS